METTDVTGGVVCRNCGNSGYDMFGLLCVCPAGRAATAAASTGDTPPCPFCLPLVVRMVARPTDTAPAWHRCPRCGYGATVTRGMKE